MRSPIIALKVILTAVIVLAASSKLSAAGSADSIVFQNDSTFTIEGYQNELQQDGDWIKVTKAEIDPDGVTQGDGFDDEINTEYVWRPRNVEPGWTPYTNGYWSYTNCGWMWTSFYSWGWRPYHYGRWWWSEYYGWVWSPGFVWAPAWVVWMYNDGYCGWYPISPRVRWHHDYGYRCHHMRYRVRHWTFCEKPRFHDPLHPPVVIIDPSGNGGIIPGSTYEGNVKIEGSTVVNQGPSKNDIESASGRVVEKVDVVKYNNVTKVTGIKDDGRNNSGKSTEVYNDTKKLYEKQYEYKENNGGKTTDDGSGNKRVEKNQDPNTNKENQNTRESEKKTNEKTYENKEKKSDDSFKNKDTYKSNDRSNEKKSNDNTYKEKQKDTYKSNDRSNEKRSDEKRSNDNKQDSKPPKDNNDKGSKNDNGKK